MGLYVIENLLEILMFNEANNRDCILKLIMLISRVEVIKSVSFLSFTVIDNIDINNLSNSFFILPLSLKYFTKNLKFSSFRLSSPFYVIFFMSSMRKGSKIKLIKKLELNLFPFFFCSFLV